MGSRVKQFRRWDHGAFALFFASVFAVSLAGYVSSEEWMSAMFATLGLGISVLVFRHRPGVIVRANHLTIFSDWYIKRTVGYSDIDRIEVTEGSWSSPVQLVLTDNTRRNFPMLGFGRRPNRYERKLIDELAETVLVQWIESP